MVSRRTILRSPREETGDLGPDEKRRRSSRPARKPVPAFHPKACPAGVGASAVRGGTRAACRTSMLGTLDRPDDRIGRSLLCVHLARKSGVDQMLSSWWLMWMLFMLLFVVPPVGYGWAYRGWGPPYPRYIQRWRGRQMDATGGSASFNHHSWGWGGDFVWMVLLLGGVCAVWALWWR